MQSGHINITQPKLPVHQIYSVCVDAARRFFRCSLLLHVINLELTVLSVWLTPPPA